MGSRFSALRSQPTSSILPTASSHHRTTSHPISHHNPDTHTTTLSPTAAHTTARTASHDFSASPALAALLGPTLPAGSAYWSGRLLDLCQSLSLLSAVTSTEVEAVLSRSCRAMYASTIAQQHRNLHQLMLVVGWHMERLVERLAPGAVAGVAAVDAEDGSQLSLDEVLNLLFLCRTFLGYIIEHATAEQLLACFAYSSPPFPPPSPSSASSQQSLPVSALFLSSLFSVLCRLPVTPATYDFHLELLHTLLTLLSTQLYQPTAPLQPSHHPFLSAALYILPTLPPPNTPQPQPPASPAHVMAALLSRYAEEVCAHYERPAGTAVDGAVVAVGGRRSLLVSLRSGLSSILLLPYHIYRYFFPPPPLPYPLADRALLCFLLLAHQQHVPARPNPYRTALSQLADTDDGGSVSFDGVYSALLYTLPSRCGVLLLFSLLHLVPAFLAYCYAKTEIELLILPLLHSLYNHIRSLDTPNKSSSSAAAPFATATAATTAQLHPSQQQQQQLQAEPKDVYMLLIILLLLTSDSSFVLQAHRQTLSRIPWHTDYQLYNISLASFISLLLLRLLSAQLSCPAARRDGYVVSNVLAILANVSREGRAVHAAVARRMVSVLEVLVKRWKRVKKRERMVAVVAGGAAGGGVEEEARDVLGVLSQYLTVLCVYAHPSHLHENIPLLYALMHDKRYLSLLADETRLAIDQRVTYLLGLIAHFELVVDVYNRQQKHKPTLHTLPLQLITATQASTSALPAPAAGAAAGGGGGGELDPLLGALAADASHWRLTVAGSSLGAYVVEGECFQYVEEEGSFEFVIPYVWEVGREEGGWKDGWGSGAGDGGVAGGGLSDEGDGLDDLSEDVGLLAGEEVRVNGSTTVVGVLAV